MTESSRPQPEQTLEAYLDGLLEGPEREAFERRIEKQPDLQAAVRQQRAIDSALKRVIGSPPLARLNRAPDPTTAARSPATSATGAWRLAVKRLAVAAALAGGVFGAWQIFNVLRPDSGGYQPMAWRNLETVYRDEIETGFEPSWVCENDEEFRQSFSKSHGQPLLLAQLPDRVSALGLAYCNSITLKTTYLLATVEDERVIVFVDRRDRDPGQTLSPGSDLHLYSRQVGSLVLYELSPLDQPRLLDHFYDPDG